MIESLTLWAYPLVSLSLFIQSYLDIIDRSFVEKCMTSLEHSTYSDKGLPNARDARQVESDQGEERRVTRAEVK